MIEQRAHAHWEGGLKEGSGSFGSTSLEGRYSFGSRFEGQPGGTPEELIGAAHASCFSMALALVLEQRGHTPVAIDTNATVLLDPQRLAITRIELETEAEVPGLADSEFRQSVEEAKDTCPVSKALSGVQIVIRSSRLKQMAGRG